MSLISWRQIEDFELMPNRYKERFIKSMFTVTVDAKDATFYTNDGFDENNLPLEYSADCVKINNIVQPYRYLEFQSGGSLTDVTEHAHWNVILPRGMTGSTWYITPLVLFAEVDTPQGSIAQLDFQLSVAEHYYQLIADADDFATGTVTIMKSSLSSGTMLHSANSGSIDTTASPSPDMYPAYLQLKCTRVNGTLQNNYNGSIYLLGVEIRNYE